MDNPIKQIREIHKLSVQDFSRHTGVDSQVIYLVESGAYIRIPPRISDFLKNHLNINIRKLSKEYAHYRREKREAFRENYKLQVPLPDTETSPVEALRKNLKLSKAALIRAACVEPAVLYMVESGRVGKLPQTLRAALIECGLTIDEVNEIEEHQNEFCRTREKIKQ